MKKIFFPNYLKVVAIMTIANILVLFFRKLIIDTPIHDTLLLNLFHGFVPLALAYFLQVFYDRINALVFWTISFVWLLYYPNSPYMISGLKHVSSNPINIQNYDTLIIFSLAILSLFYGFISLKIMHSLFIKRNGKKVANIAIAITLLLSCLGFYMGRVLLLFSDDFFKHPIKIIIETWNHLFPISTNLSTYVLMILFGGVQLMLLVMFRYIKHIQPNSIITSNNLNKTNK
jgi:uncharacterized membrane protein